MFAYRSYSSSLATEETVRRNNVSAITFLRLPDYNYTNNKNKQTKKQYSMINFALTEKLGKKNSEFQMAFVPTTLRDLVGCSTTELLETLW